MLVTIQHLKAIAGGSAPLAAKIVGPINKYAGELTPLELCHFLAHCAVETQWFKSLTENLNYTTTKRLRAVWPSRFKSDAAAQPYIRQPQKLAEFVYGNRKTLGNTTALDGWTYFGRGLKQTTGKYNYEVIEKETGIPVVANPELMADPDIGTKAAVIYFMKRVRTAANKDDIKASTKAVNGGYTGLSERTIALNRAKKIYLSGSPSKAEPKLDNKETIINIYDGKVHSEVRKVQDMLRDLGWYEVGNPDGRYGTRTDGAIAAFRKQAGLPVGRIDDALRVALMKSEKRPVSDERKNATVETIKDAPSVKDGLNLETVGKSVIGIGGAGSIFNGITTFTDATDHLNQVKSFWDAFASASPYMLLAVAGGVILYFGQRFVRHQLEGYQQGRHL